MRQSHCGLYVVLFPMLIKQIVYVAIGGGLGSVLRFLTYQFISKWNIPNFPLATFMVNIVGCLIIGALIGLSLKNNIISHDMKLFLVTGFCGGYTTFSAFALENWELFEMGNYGILALNIGGSVLLGITVVFLGIYLFR